MGEVPLPGVPLDTPMTYMVNGRQYFALTTLNGQLGSMALPQSAQPR